MRRTSRREQQLNDLVPIGVERLAFYSPHDGLPARRWIDLNCPSCARVLRLRLDASPPTP